MTKGQKISQQMLVICGLGLMIILLAMGGCGKKEEPVETDMEVPTEQPAPPVIEPEPAETETTPMPAVDFAAMEPAEYGIEDVFFAFDVYDLSSEAMTILSANARIMREHPDLVWLIEGHCDERGTVEYNLALGEKRALAVREYLTSLGVPARQLRFTSYGEERPFAMGSNESAWAQNRRAHFANP